MAFRSKLFAIGPSRSNKAMVCHLKLQRNLQIRVGFRINSPMPLPLKRIAVRCPRALCSAGSVAFAALNGSDDSGIGLTRVARLLERRDRETAAICAHLDNAALPDAGTQLRLRNSPCHACPNKLTPSSVTPPRSGRSSPPASAASTTRPPDVSRRAPSGLPARSSR